MTGLLRRILGKGKTHEIREAPTKIDLSWLPTKEPLARLVNELGIYNFPVYDLGHCHRGLETFPDAISISGLEDSELYATGWDNHRLGLKAKIDASRLLGQLARHVETYLNSGDEEIFYPASYAFRLESFKRLAEKGKGIEVKLKMEAREPKKPEFELKEWEIVTEEAA